MRLQLATWPEVEAYLQRSQGILVPIGSTEQHGPMGFVGTDALCPEGVCWELGERHGVLVAPTLSLGMAQHHLGFPGTISLRPTTLIALVRDVVQSLARHGFERLVFVNGHGGNTATLDAAFAELYADTSFQPSAAGSLRCTQIAWWESDSVRAVAEAAFGEAEGWHGTPAELSVSYLRFPEHAARVRRERLEPPIPPKGPIYDAADFRRRYADGRMGSDSTLANDEIGRKLFDAAVEDVWERYKAFLAED